ncbi:hypothetical protein J5N97_003834 [Dioscorea zingiberensis]|uniref:C2H2-type domain-containing protein n=1 Tax=Dioscorea zingiberensis TaxID=325984 RepID=A0A9D5D7B7_9LILI|nr:hypothetical protein J5N97_003834 [Dioscorea zingiberensis]
MSNATTASVEASASSNPVLKRKRNLPGNPDPDAEVIALSPKTLMATNRFVCEICNKGFQRDQNLQLHRRGHNLPWKLKQRPTNKEVKKKVYVCPEVSCVHHDPCRALGDLTGIKKHFSRKHGEKKWKCDKCSKKYAVQSDWKAHSKICGTRERDSFITHRAFCDALAEESARSIIHHPLIEPSSSSKPNCQGLMMNQVDLFHEFSYEDKHFSKAASAHLSATALLQKAAEMGAGTSKAQESSQMAGHTACSALSSGLDGSFERVIFGERNVGSHHGGGDGMTRDFLGLRPIYHTDILSMTGLDPCMNSSSSYEQAQ